MTTNQINWVNAQENKRANLANEELKRESNRITSEHNRADESIRSQSNLISESHYQRLDDETKRHNIKGEELQDVQLGINQGHLKVAEYEAKTGRGQLDVARQNAATNALNAQTNIRSAEIAQQNADTNRYNAATQATAVSETARHNRMTERLGLQSNQIQSDYNTERIRQQDYVNTVDAVYKQGQLSNDNKITESNINVNTARIADLVAETRLADEKAQETHSRRFLNYTQGAKNVSDTVNSWIE